MNIKKLAVTAALGVGLALGIGFAGPTVADAYEVMENTAGYFGFDGKFNYCGVLVKESEWDIVPFLFKFEYGADEDALVYRNDFNEKWRVPENAEKHKEVWDAYYACYRQLRDQFRYQGT